MTEKTAAKIVNDTLLASRASNRKGRGVHRLDRIVEASYQIGTISEKQNREYRIAMGILAF